MSYEQDFFSARLIKQITVKIPLEMKEDGIGYDTISENDIRQAIEYDIKSILLTAKGERFDPNFGVGMNSFLFEGYNTAKIASLRPSIISQISRYMPWLSNFNVGVTPIPSKNALQVDIKYKVNTPQIVGHFNMLVSLSDV
tara:strand:+ start:22 stop:444 length:423 start_codon:yes stop_codon:yes gene_type:complete